MKVPREFKKIIKGLRRNASYLDSLLRGDEDISLTEAAVFLNDPLLDDWAELDPQERQKCWRWILKLGEHYRPAKIAFSPKCCHVEISLSDELARHLAICETLRKMLYKNSFITGRSLDYEGQEIQGPGEGRIYRDPIEAIEVLFNILADNQTIWADTILL